MSRVNWGEVGCPGSGVWEGRIIGYGEVKEYYALGQRVECVRINAEECLGGRLTYLRWSVWDVRRVGEDK